MSLTVEVRRRLIVLAVLSAGLLTYLPSLRSPFLLDDYLQRAMVTGHFPSARSPFDLYDFVNDGDRAVLLERGLIPWWSHPQLRLRFFRPLSSALLWADHRLFGTRAILLHLQSFAWWAFAVLAARALYIKAFSPRVALLATIIFALAPCHAIPLAWLANREVLVSIAFGTLGLSAYLRWREERTARDAAVTTVLFALAMLAGEYGLCFAGYVVVIELCTAREGLARRAGGLMPFAGPLAVYLLVRSTLGYGAFGSGFYSDPLSDPAAYLASAPGRLCTLLADAWLNLETDWGGAPSGWHPYAVTVAAFALLAVPIKRAFAELAPDARKTATWLLFGSVFALVPVVAVVPSTRLLGVCVLGIAPVIALVLDHAWFPAVTRERRGWAELTLLMATVLGFLHLIRGPVTSWLTARNFCQSAEEFVTHTASLRVRLDGAATADVVVVRGMVGAFFEPYALDVDGAPPLRWRILAHTGHVLVLRRDLRTVEVIARQDQGLFPEGHGNLFRAKNAALKAGDEIVAAGLHATILKTGEHGPYAVRFVMDRDLETSDLRWISEDHGGFVDVAPPSPGFGVPLDP